jgi:hypothetical protein
MLALSQLGFVLNLFSAECHAAEAKPGHPPRTNDERRNDAIRQE